MKLQINTKEGLYQLIASDKELEIQIKKSILNDFAKNYLKSVANSEIIEQLKKDILREIKTNNYYGIVEKFYNDKYLSDKIKQQIRDEVKKAITTEIELQAYREVDNLIVELKDSIKTKIERYDSDTKIESIVRELITSRINTIISKLS